MDDKAETCNSEVARTGNFGHIFSLLSFFFFFTNMDSVQCTCNNKYLKLVLNQAYHYLKNSVINSIKKRASTLTARM